MSNIIPLLDAAAPSAAVSGVGRMLVVGVEEIAAQHFRRTQQKTEAKDITTAEPSGSESEAEAGNSLRSGNHTCGCEPNDANDDHGRKPENDFVKPV